MRLIDAYDWDFCMIQYNYVDEYSQAGARGLKYASLKGIPVIIMEPLRGGRLADKLPKEAKALFAGFTPKRSPAEWAFRWLYSQKEVSVVLSGMNSIGQIEENVRVASASARHDRRGTGAVLQGARVIRRILKSPAPDAANCIALPAGR
jgi:predicted aldo/keto reductase-like oxidoreductase